MTTVDYVDRPGRWCSIRIGRLGNIEGIQPMTTNKPPHTGASGSPVRGQA